MRLTASQTRLVADRVRRHLGARAKIWLFGSRLDDHKRGGDVGLYVETEYSELLPEIQMQNKSGRRSRSACRSDSQETGAELPDPSNCQRGRGSPVTERTKLTGKIGLSCA